MDSLDDAAGHGSHVRAPVAPDLRFVAHSSQGEAHELAVQGPGDRATERGLSDARRADEAEDRSLQGLFQGVDGEVLEDALLDLFDVVVVLVENLARPLDVLRVRRQDAPGKTRHPVQVGSDDRGFRGVGVTALQALDLLFDLGGRLAWNLSLGDELAIMGELFVDLLSFAELLLNRPQLLAQVVLPLRPVHFPPGLGGDLLLHRQNGDLLGETLVDVAEAFDRIGGLEHLLGFLELQIEVGGRQVRQASGVVEIRGDHHHFRRDVLPQGNGLLEVLLDAAQQSLVLRRQLFGNLFLFQARDLGLQVRFFGEEGVHPGPCQTLHQQADAPVGQLEHSHDRDDGADLVEVLGTRSLVGGVLLGAQHDDPLFGQGRVHGEDRLLPRDGEGQDDERKDHHVLQRQNR